MTLIEAARNDIGQIESVGEIGFKDKHFETAMRDVGYSPGWNWDSIIIEKWIRQAMPERATELNGYIVASSMATFRNLKNAGYGASIVPTVGALVFFQYIQDGFAIWLGRAGVVSHVISGTEFYSIQGDCRVKGDAQGIARVEENKHYLQKIVHDGLKVLGFITL